jgi:hypothetical protein
VKLYPLIIIVGLAAATSAACGKKEALSPIGSTNGLPTSYPKKTSGAGQIVVGNLITQVTESSLGPYWVKRGSGPTAAGLVGWLTPAEGVGRRIFVVPVDGTGAPRGAEVVAANVPLDTVSVGVKAMRGPTPGFVLTWTSLTDRGKALWTIAVNDKGEPRGKPVEITRSNDDINWVDVVPTDRGAVIMWAEETRGGSAKLVGASLDAEGKVRESAIRLAGGVSGWDVVEIPGGIGLASVASNVVSFQRLDADGHPQGIASTVATASGNDIDIALDKNRVVFAWTDHRGTEEPAIALATMTLDPHDKNAVEGPRRVAEARGGAQLLGVTSGPTGPAVMFEAPARRKDEGHRVHVARIGEHLWLDRPSLNVDTVGKTRPELAATATGFALLATAPDCDVDSPACPNAPETATLFRTDAKMNLVQREPLTFGSDPAGLGWGLTCEDDVCAAMTASGTPARIRVAAVRQRVNAKPPAPAAETTETAIARIDDITAVSTGESIVHIATAKSLVATLGKDPKRGDDYAAVATHLVDEQGLAGKAEIIAPKAMPLGGVGIALADKPEDGGAVAWVGNEGSIPQVHVTRIDKKGHRTSDVILTSARGDKTDVTITSAGNGYVVAWVDGREGNGEIFAAKLGLELNRSGKDERITNAPGDASDLVAIGRGDNVWLAFADPRESPTDGVADVYVTAVAKKDAKRAFDEQRMLASAAHSRTPKLANTPGGISVAWIEEAPAGSESPSGGGYGAFWAKLDDIGKPVARPARIPLAGDGAATAVAIEGTHAVIARAMMDAIALDGVDLVSSKAAPMLALDGPPSLDVSLLFEGPILYFNDDGPQPADRRTRRAKLVWNQ